MLFRSTRLSPEAPVPIVRYGSEYVRLGGAANVAHNLAALGARVSLVGVVGADAAGRRLKGELEVAGVDAIFIGHNKRTAETAAVIAGQTNTSVEARDQDNVASYMRYIMRHHNGDIVLVVADGEAIPVMIDELHGSKRLPPFDPNDFDEIYIVTTPWYGKVKTLRLHYGASSGVVVEESSEASGG